MYFPVDTEQPSFPQPVFKLGQVITLLFYSRHLSEFQKFSRQSTFELLSCSSLLYVMPSVYIANYLFREKKNLKPRIPRGVFILRIAKFLSHHSSSFLWTINYFFLLHTFKIISNFQKSHKISEKRSHWLPCNHMLLVWCSVTLKPSGCTSYDKNPPASQRRAMKSV